MKLSNAFAFVALGSAMFTVTPAHAQTVAPGPYYATPSWDQTLPASTRFIVLSNMKSEAVLDRETGLVWERSPAAGALRWDLAHLHCNARATGGRKGWRLPGVQELTSISDPAVEIPALPPGHPFNVSGGHWWTSTSSTFGPGIDAAYFVLFDSFGDTTVMAKANSALVWCVRGGQGVDFQ